jgi:hypothetical protein
MRNRYGLRFGRGVGSPSDGESGTDTTSTSDGTTTESDTNDTTGDAETDGRGVG